ncbi:Protein FMP25 [Paramyrothecium foliicola]|nr:Protein FMP25 [Paramyrothecium foliicola]
MKTSRVPLGRVLRPGCPAQPKLRTAQWVRRISDKSAPQGRDSSRGSRGGGGGPGKAFGFAAVFAVAAAGAFYYPTLKELVSPTEPVETGPAKPELEFEKPRKQAVSKEDNRDLISSQHLQVKSSWEHPGVYVWGSNVGKVVDPNSDEKVVKLPRRLSHFDGQLLRDLKLSQSFGAAVTENGDLVQWGLGFSKTHPGPSTTLKGKDIIKIDVSADRIIALSRNGSVFSVPASTEDQQGGTKADQQQSSWAMWSSGGSEKISFRSLTPSNLGRGEKVTDIKSGLEHCLMLTSMGRVFSAASSATAFPSKGQMGIPGLSWETRPQGPYDQPHEVTALSGFQAEQIATGDFHSVVLDKLGRVFTFGDNTFGQLGYNNEGIRLIVDTPTMVSVNKLYGSSGLLPKVTSIAAGGLNTFFTIDASAPERRPDQLTTVPGKRVPLGVSDLWAAGQGVYGSLGTGKWTHVSGSPVKIKGLSSLFEFDEKTNKNVPIKIKSISVGSTHSAAVMDNVTNTTVSSRGSENDTNWGADVMFWGGNEHYQLGTGKRTNMNAPTYIGPLDGGEGDAEKGRKGEMHRLCLTPRQTVRIGEDGRGRKVSLEQKVECGKFVTGVYSAA